MIDAILPAEVTAVEAFGDVPGGTLFPAEEAAIARAVDKRRREFSTGRACAHAALVKLGLPPAPILRGPHGAPVWPDGVVGSITHCDGYRAAAVARAEDVLTVGLDAEPDRALPDGVLDRISVAEERAWLRETGARPPGVSWDRLLFSAKESVYKAWFPLAGRWLGFEEAVITIDPSAGVFTARLVVPGPVIGGQPLTGFSGRWSAGHGLVMTAIAVPAGPDLTGF
ncbi:MAG TPA: 4'-phosphopantetheinyl transferase superfamily protein [Streptosporangiaceae bacterium]